MDVSAHEQHISIMSVQRRGERLAAQMRRLYGSDHRIGLSRDARERAREDAVKEEQCYWREPCTKQRHSIRRGNGQKG